MCFGFWPTFYFHPLVSRWTCFDYSVVYWCPPVLLVFDRNTTEHDGTWRNTTEHDRTRRNMTEHDATWRNTTKHDGILYIYTIYIYIYKYIYICIYIYKWIWLWRCYAWAGCYHHMDCQLSLWSEWTSADTPYGGNSQPMRNTSIVKFICICIYI